MNNIELKQKMQEQHKSTLAEKIVKSGGILYGGYVYKTLIAGEPSRDIDVCHPDPEKLITELSASMKCIVTDSEEKFFNDAFGLDCVFPGTIRAVHIDVVSNLPPAHAATGWVIFSTLGLQCTGNISEAKCNSRIRMLAQRKIPRDVLVRPKDFIYFDISED